MQLLFPVCYGLTKRRRRRCCQRRVRQSVNYVRVVAAAAAQHILHLLLLLFLAPCLQIHKFPFAFKSIRDLIFASNQSGPDGSPFRPFCNPLPTLQILMTPWLILEADLMRCISQSVTPSSLFHTAHPLLLLLQLLLNSNNYRRARCCWSSLLHHGRRRRRRRE